MAYKVLIVDDEEIVCRGLAKFVKWQEYGFSVEGIAYSVDEALALMERTAMMWYLWISGCRGRRGWICSRSSRSRIRASNP